MRLSPWNEAFARFAGWVIHADGWVNLDQPGIVSPPKQTPRRIEKVPRLVRLGCAPLFARKNHGLGDTGVWLMPGGLFDLREDVVTPSPRPLWCL